MVIKKRTLIKALLLSAVVLTALFASAWFFISSELSNLEVYKDSITKTVGKALNRDVTYEKGKASLTIRAGLALQFTNVVIRKKNQPGDLLNITNAFFRVDILPLLRGRVVLGDVLLDQPRLSLSRDRNGVFNIADLLTSDQKPQIKFRKLTIEKGSVTFLDQAVGDEDLITALTNLSCRIETPRWGNKSSFRITATVNEDKNRGELALKGTCRPAPAAKPLTESALDVVISVKGMDIHHYRPYLAGRIPLEQVAGRLDAEAAFSGTLSRFTSKGNVSLQDVLLGYPQVFRGSLQSRAAHADYALTRRDGHLQLDVARMAVDRLEASGRLVMEDLGQPDPLLAASVKTSTFSLKEVQSYIPWGIIPENVGSFIEAHIKDGDFRLVEGKLDGRLSRIKNINQRENSGVLSIRAEVSKGVFVIGDTTPAFQDISGIMELKNRQFLLKNMVARFGASPCKLEGGISDFALPEPAVYTADMTVQPSREEVVWLAGKEKFRNFNFQGASRLELSGKGLAENFRIGARWDLTDAAYTLPQVMEKPQGRPNRLNAEIILNKDAVTVSSFNYDLPPVNVSGSALYRFGGKKNVSLNVQSKAFDISAAVSVLPVLRTFNPAGTCLINVTGRGNPDDFRSFQWKGGVSLTNVSLKPAEGITPVRGLTGKVIFQGNRIATSRFSARIGGSSFFGKCGINDFRKPQVACQFETALFRSTDMGWQTPEGAVNFRDVKGRIAVRDGSIHVEKLSLRLGKSLFHLSGDVRGFAGRKITVSLSSPYINFADVAPLITMKPLKRKNAPSSPVDVTATVLVEAGVLKGVGFKKLNAGVRFTGETLYIKTLEAGIFEGKLTGKGRVDIRSNGQNRYESSFSIERISLDKIQGFLEMGEREVKGNLSLTGHVTATGSDVYDLKKTAVGNFQLSTGKGVLKKFSVLSKIFSLLNVFQLARLQLPDMAAGGMPYSAITASLTLRDGVLSSNDFFIDSDAMQISAVGKIDLLREKLDSIVGVHPLDTIDKIVARIPVAGWLLTDDKGNLFTVSFKVDGKWDDPRVIPIPIRSMAEGTLNIFRRLFQLPEKLVTDTGEVILGH